MIDLASISRNLVQSGDGQWRCKSSSPVAYPEWGNQACFQIEDSSFWFQHRNGCILEALRQFPPGGPLFDVGGGNGFVAKAMQDAGIEVVLLEPGVPGARNARARGIHHVVCASLEDAGFVPGSLAAVALFDVLEHIEDDRRCLQMIRTYLSSGGRIYLTVPAYQALWSHTDIAAGHYRRYDKAGLDRLLEMSGFAVEFLTGYFRFLPPPILAARALPFRLGMTKSGGLDATNGGISHHQLQIPWIRRAIRWAQQKEIERIRERRAMSFGGSWLAVARSRDREAM